MRQPAEPGLPAGAAGLLHTWDFSNPLTRDQVICALGLGLGLGFARTLFDRVIESIPESSRYILGIALKKEGIVPKPTLF